MDKFKFSYHFEQSEMSTITVRSMKKILHHDFLQQRRKERSLSLFPLLSARSSSMVKVGGCVYQEVFEKQLQIIKVRLLLQNRALKYLTKNS